MEGSEKMRRRRAWWLPRSLEVRGLVLVFLVGVTIGLPGFFISRTLSLDEERRHASAEEALLAVALRAYLYAATDMAPDDQAWLEECSRQEERILWAGVYDEQGRGVEFRRRTGLPVEDILEQLPLGATETRFEPLVVSGRPSERYRLLSVPVSDGSGLLAAIVELPEAAEGAAGLLGAWIAAAGVGLALGLAWFHVALLRPMQDLGSRVRRLRLGLNEAVLSEEAPQELRDLVAGLDQTAQELHRLRRETESLHRELESRVDAKTRKITRRLSRAERAAETDELTGLKNRRVLERDLPELVAGQQSRGEELCALWIDMDRFKELNDTLGHAAGDAMLAFMGDLLRGAIRRENDLAVRYGGDEFVLLLPGTRLSEAEAVATRLRRLFGQRAMLVAAEGVRPDLSIGVAAMREHGLHTGPALLSAADAAMYRAKQGRLGVAVAEAGEIAKAQEATTTPVRSPR